MAQGVIDRPLSLVQIFGGNVQLQKRDVRLSETH
jgi:hypothetical protein